MILGMLELSAKKRQILGSKNKTFRKNGFVPAVLYGHTDANVNLMLDSSNFNKAYKKAGESTLLKLKIDGDEERTVLIHDVAKDPVKGDPIHVDFYQVKMDEAIAVEVPLVFVGESEAVEREGGVLIKNIQYVEVEALPQDLPNEIKVDISFLKTFDDNIHIKDLKASEKITIMAEPDETVASVVPPRSQEELEELDEAPVESTEEVEVEEKGKAKEEAGGEESLAPEGNEPAA